MELFFHFRVGDTEDYFIGSADAMRRNLSSRIEILVPVEDPELREHLRFILDTELGDRRNAWDMQPDGSYVQLQPEEGGEDQGSQELLIRWSDKRQKKAAKVRKRKPMVLGPRPGGRKI